MTGVILAGGRSSRMGKNKAFLEIEGERLIDRTVRLFRGLFSEILLVTNDPLAYLDLEAVLATDIFPGKGALGGLYTGLFFARHPQAFVTACDMPFLQGDFISHLLAQAPGYDIVIPEAGGGLQPLHAVYDRRCLPAIRACLDRNRLKISGFYRGLRIRTIGEGEAQAYDPDGRMFWNINGPKDLEKLSGG